MRFLIGLLLAVLLLAAPAFAHDFRLGSLEIAHPWTRATPPGATTGGAFLAITNNGETADRLLGGTSPLGRVELHTMAMTDGIMKMRPIDGGLTIPAGETVTLAPGGLHLMVTGLKAPIAVNTQPSLTLSFEKAGEIEVRLAVEPIGAPAPPTHR